EGEDLERFRALGVRTVIDLRYPWEIEARGRVPESVDVQYLNFSIEHRAYDQAEIDPDVDPWRFLADRHAEVASDGAAELRGVLEAIAGAGDGALVFHCASGKDRTGIVAALVLSLLCVSEADIATDFALTELATARLVADWRAANADRVLGWPSYGRAPATIIQHFLGDLTAAHGSVEAYIKDGVGVGDDVVAVLRERLLER
ncbi:MAG: protein-tyrosine phosphatase, partial [Baekduia sp.]|nr:protein-tyrosine phosphatase [Baekduia sp.]